MIKVGAVGGLMGVIAEVWYFRDYWRPPTLFGEGVVGFEDYIIGFALFWSRRLYPFLIHQKTDQL